MKKIIAALLVLVMTAGLVACGTPAKESAAEAPAAAEQPAATESAVSVESTEAAVEMEPITIKFADFHATSTIQWQAVQMFESLVEEKSGGNISIETYPAGQLGAQAELEESVKNGTIQMTWGNSPTLSNYVPEFAVLDLPYIFTDYAHIKSVLYGDVGEELNQLLIEKTGMRILTWVHSGFRDMLTSEEPINTLADFAGVKFRSPEAFAYVEMFKALGAVPTPMAWTEVYEAVRTNIVDGLETTTEAIVSNKFWEVCKYVMVSHHIYTAETPIINEAFWQGLTDQQKTWINESWAEVTLWANEQIEQKEQGFYDTMEQNGMTLIYIDRQPLIDACSVVWDLFVEKNPDAQSLIEQINALR